MRVFVLDKHKRPLMPCTPKRARLLLERGQAVVHRRYPFTIRLRQRTLADSHLQPVLLKLDPGSQTSGIAVVSEAPMPAGPLHHALHLAEITHRGTVVHLRLRTRAASRRRRRSKNLRYRAPRFHNRRRKAGWLPPSIRSRVDNLIAWTVRYRRLAPVQQVELELVKFDTQVLQHPEITGVAYQRGELVGYEVRQYVLHKWGHRCAYCGRQDLPLQLEHIVPQSRGGSDRVGNLCPACEPCNQQKGGRTAAEFGHPDVQAHASAPLRDAAAVNSSRYAVLAGLRALGLAVRCWSGGRTKWNRSRLGVAKGHALDALCVGVVGGVTGARGRVLGIRAMGRGQRLRSRFDRYGFPRGYLPRHKRVFGFATGDLVRADVVRGQHLGIHTGRVAVRVSGSFRVGTRDGIHWRRCTLLARGDGYEYSLSARIDPTTHHLPEGAAPPYLRT